MPWEFPPTPPAPDLEEEDAEEELPGGAEAKDTPVDADEIYRGLHSLEWLDVMTEVAQQLLPVFDEDKFQCFKVIVNEQSFETAVRELATQTTTQNIDKLLTKCKLKVRGTKKEKTMAAALWKSGLQ
jgi:hypothetical protein